MFFNPLTFLFMIIFFFAVLFFFAMVQINIIALAFARIGIPSQYIFAALFASLFGSLINIPVKKIPQEIMTDERRVSFFGFRHVVPVRMRNETVIAVNVGGAIVPAILSIYLLFKTGVWGSALVATGLMTIVTFRLARPVKGIGIALPAFLPGVVAALISVIIAYNYAPVVAYIAGTMGTLLGADILNLKKISGLGAPVASIGGAGTFDGIFLNGILAVLLAALVA